VHDNPDRRQNDQQIAPHRPARKIFKVGLQTAREVVNISRAGLKARNRLNGDGVDESIFLAPLDEVLAKKATLAEDLLSLYHGRWHGSVEPVFEDYQY